MSRHEHDEGVHKPLERVLREQEEELSRLISKGNRWFSRADPELLRVLGKLCGRIGEVRRHRLLRRDGADEARERLLDERLCELLRRRRLGELNVSAAWDYERELALALYEIADDLYIRAQLISEWAVQYKGAYAPYGPWSKHLDVRVLDDLVGQYADGRQTADTRRLAVECLTFLYNERHEVGRGLTLNTRLRTRYLGGLMLMMATLLVVLLVVIHFISNGVNNVNINPFWLFGRGLDIGLAPDFRYAVLSAATGALGSVMSGFYKLRDKGKYLSDLRSFRSAMLAQPFVGACIGLLLFLILRSRILGISFVTEGAEWAAYSIFGFIGGFSEPFFLGIVESVARKGEREGRGDRDDEGDAERNNAGGDGGGRKDGDDERVGADETDVGADEADAGGDVATRRRAG